MTWKLELHTTRAAGFEGSGALALLPQERRAGQQDRASTPAGPERLGGCDWVCYTEKELQTPGTAEEHKRQETPTINAIDRQPSTVNRQPTHGWLHGVFVGDRLFVFPLCGFSLSLFCNFNRHTSQTRHQAPRVIHRAGWDVPVSAGLQLRVTW